MLYLKLQPLFKYLIRIGDSISQLLNVTLLFGQNANESISGRSYRLGRTRWPWATLKTVINIIFFWQEDHCREAYFADLRRARQLVRDHQGAKHGF
jgi:hypothetical protein